MEELRNLEIPYTYIKLGEVEIAANIPSEKIAQLKQSILGTGLELMDDKKAMLIEKIKNVIVELVHHSDELPKTNFSDYLANKLDYDYTYMANLFSETEGTTIEQFVMMHKIERVKELIIYDELNLTEIAWKLHYSSVSHLSNQFKKITGLTPSFFKSIKMKKRGTLQKV